MNESSPNLLGGTYCYTMGAMEYANGENWRNRVKEVLTKRWVRIFDPYHKPFVNHREENEFKRQQLQQWMEREEYDEVHNHMREVRSDDLRMVDKCDFGIVQVIPKVASWGTAEELSWIVRRKAPAYIFVEGGKKKCPLWIMGQVPHSYIFNSLEDVLNQLIRIDDGHETLDNRRWRLLKKEYR